MNVIMLLHHLHDWNMAWSPELDVGLLVRSAWHVVTAETQQTDLDPKSLSSLSEKNMLCHDFLVGGFKHEWIILYYFPISYMGCHPSH